MASAWQRQLAAIAKPRQLELPFADLRAHFAAVDAAAPDDGTLSGDLAAWRTRTIAAARAEAELGSLALAKLAGAFATWQAERSTLAAGDSVRIGELEQRLDGIEQAREVLRELVPAVRDAVDRDLPRSRLGDARLALKDASVAPTVVDVTASLDEVRRALAERGPSADLRDRVDKLAPTKADQIAARNALLNDLATAEFARAQIEASRINRFPIDPQPPFDDVEDYWQALERALDPLRAADGAVPPWAAALRAEKRAEDVLQAYVVSACTTAFTRWQQLVTGPDTVAELARLRHAKERALQLFPAAQPAIEVAIPPGALVTAEVGVARTAKKQRWTIDADKLRRQLAGVATFADWNTNAPSATESLANLRTAAGELGVDADVARELERLGGIVDRWQSVVARMAEFDQKLAAGELKAAAAIARAGLAGTEARDEFTAASDVVAACVVAFDVLGRNLGIDAAEGSLTAARAKLSATAWAGEAEQRLDAWVQALQRLRAATAGMVAIPGARPKGGVAAVDSFFLASTECSRAEFAQFLTDLRAAVADATDPQQRFDAVSTRLQGTGMNPDRLQELLDREVRADKTPVDNVTWYAAAAYAAWYGRALPTASEWAVAAFGDGGQYAFPWGNEWSNEPQHRNPSNQKLADVDAGGLSWRQADGVRLHHLAGNVAEWLAADAGSRSASLAGGRYTDTSDTSIREQATGRTVEAEKADARRGFGFRTVLRPRSFPGLQWPRD